MPVFSVPRLGIYVFLKYLIHYLLLSLGTP